MDKHRLDEAAEAGIITREQANHLAIFFAADAPVTAVTAASGAPAVAPARFDVSHLLWYAGALIVIGALTLFTTLAFEQAGPSALTWTAVAYAFGFVLLVRLL